MKKDASPYEKAHQEWSDRLGNARTQAKNWQSFGLISLVLLILFLIAFIVLVSSKKTYVYVAQVAPNQSTQMVRLPQTLTATSVQQAYFVGQFITKIMSLPLDPVIARQNWFDAYAMSSNTATAQLTAYAQSTSPFAHLGQLTQAVQIQRFNAVSDHSLQFQWTVDTYDNQGQLQSEVAYSGIFTLASTSVPSDETSILKNPFGLKIVYFSINKEAAS
jgi:type IV secretory pathway TrbF-like protein